MAVGTMLQTYLSRFGVSVAGMSGETIGFAAAPNPVADFNACSDLQKFTGVTPTIVRQPNTATVSVFQELLNIFKS